MTSIARSTAILFALSAALALPARAEGPDTTAWRPPVLIARAISGDWAGLRLWAEAAGFSIGRRSAGFGLQGGAALPIAKRIRLTASCRLTGYSLGDSLDPQLDDVATHSLAPILGINIRF
jgi:hypothetical protein